MLSVRVNAATDVTGVGLAGHLKEMVKENIGVEIVSNNLPYFEEAVDLAKSGFVPAGLYRNRDFYKEHVVAEKEGFFYDIIFDPQTSGGLLMAIEAADVPAFAQMAGDIGLDYWIIGKFIEEPKGKIILS